MKGYPRWFTVRLICVIMALLSLSGLLLAPGTFVNRLEYDIWSLQGDARIVTVATHCLFAFLSFALLGALMPIHMRHHWRRKRQRVSGMLLVIIFVFLGLSGVGIYYLGNQMLTVASISHLIVGLVLAFLFIAHAFVLKKS